MFRTMRRSKQQLSQELCEAILNKGSYGILSVHGDDGYPYGIPMSYVYYQGKIYLHGADAGHRRDAISRDTHVSFCVIDKSDVVAEALTVAYRSVILFGQASFMADTLEKRQALTVLGKKYAPQPAMEEHIRQSVERSGATVSMIEITIDHMTGKQGLQLMKQGI
ncbi:MAG: pyridoxamine 5'-phosphate oxidase family protein [Megasphaera sp.]|nr:pyridoxamine 5'-phosphate oxidase family protein [Megasphaera sp.]MCH4187621.1 pyridoxamine 5'-phosphate oxidase family protein [Megasphaera sp.]MCH4217183.1 pyridoxamine 5'-phosphate oxidase family protein [Megasphaera sp.]